MTVCAGEGRQTLSLTVSGNLNFLIFFFFQAEDGIRDLIVTGVQTCALPILTRKLKADRIASSGTLRVLTTRVTRFAATVQVGTATTNAAAQVCGLRYPSGMCTARSSRSPSPTLLICKLFAIVTSVGARLVHLEM